MARTKQYRLSAADRFAKRADRLDRRAVRAQRQRTADEAQEIALAYDRRTVRALERLEEATI